MHESVLVEEVLHWLAPARGGRFIDATVGGGGHAAALLEAGPIELLGIDQDTDALRLAAARLAPYGERAELVHGNAAALAAIAAGRGWDSVDGVLMDVGVSSMQIDTAERGFSYRQAGPLDMRMDRTERETAATILNTSGLDDLTFIFRTYGEVRAARRLARAVVERRETRPWQDTAEFAELVRDVVRQPPGRRGPVEAPAFQALRIAVNNELENLDIALEAAIDLLAPGGRLVIISFHSLEDRLVKRTFRDGATECICPPEIPVCVCDKRAVLKVLTRKPVTASAEECARNRRSRPAKLRAAEKLPEADS